MKDPYQVCAARARQEFLTVPDDEQRMVLICTDRASRGVDTSHVQHVVLFDFPRDPSEYVRRVGRTARGAGGEGVVSVLVLGRRVRNHLDVLTAICAHGNMRDATLSLRQANTLNMLGRCN